MNKSIKAIVAVMLTVVAIVVIGCHKPDEPNNGDNNGNNDTIEEYEYVDLGLPSGTLWATCNVGADSIEDPGDYFAWGETVTKELYDWKSYKYSTYVEGRYLLNKYCTNPFCGYDGFSDNLTVLEPGDDAATANWGENWRMATGDEWRELYQNTTCELTTQNGALGRLLTSWNGNSIFLPATGFYMDNELIYTNLDLYWTSSLQTDAQVSAWSFHSDWDNCHVCGTYERCLGICVRAVRCFQ